MTGSNSYKLYNFIIVINSDENSPCPITRMARLNGFYGSIQQNQNPTIVSYVYHMRNPTFAFNPLPGLDIHNYNEMVQETIEHGTIHNHLINFFYGGGG